MVVITTLILRVTMKRATIASIGTGQEAMGTITITTMAAAEEITLIEGCVAYFLNLLSE